MALLSYRTFFKRLGISRWTYYRLRRARVLPDPRTLEDTKQIAWSEEHLIECKRALEQYRQGPPAASEPRQGKLSSEREGARSMSASVFFDRLSMPKQKFYRLIAAGRLPSPPKAEGGRYNDYTEEYLNACWLALEPHYHAILEKARRSHRSRTRRPDRMGDA